MINCQGWEKDNSHCKVISPYLCEGNSTQIQNISLKVVIRVSGLQNKEHVWTESHIPNTFFLLSSVSLTVIFYLKCLPLFYYFILFFY